MREQWPVSYDCDAGVFTVHRQKDGLHDISFHMIEEGLHVHIPPTNSKAFVNTVADNMEGFSKRQVKQARKARELYAKLIYPSIRDFKWAIMTNQIANCSVTVKDIDAAQAIWGKDIAALKGKTVRKKPVPVAGDVRKIPKEFFQLQQDVFLTFPLWAAFPFY